MKRRRVPQDVRDGTFGDAVKTFGIVALLKGIWHLMGRNAEMWRQLEEEAAQPFPDDEPRGNSRSRL